VYVEFFLLPVGEYFLFYFISNLFPPERVSLAQYAGRLEISRLASC
jgi:hypothetical protein